MYTVKPKRLMFRVTDYIQYNNNIIRIDRIILIRMMVYTIDRRPVSMTRLWEKYDRNPKSMVCHIML